MFEGVGDAEKEDHGDDHLDDAEDAVEHLPALA
jgi:hypothetical protein